ncbi:hypothetical protein ES708_29633 [subsurface metagenome]
MKPTEEERSEAAEFLREHLKPGDTVYTILRHCSRSGMMRRISPVIIVDGKPEDIDYQVAKLGIWKRRYPHDGLVVGGCGMDMGFHVVYELSRVLFPDGFGVPCSVCGHSKTSPGDNEWHLGMCPVSTSKGCQKIGRNGDTSGWDGNGGYALKQRWL